MKILVTLLLTATLSFANYTLYYGELKLGIIEDISTIEENYIRINVTSKLARILLGGKKALVYYNQLFTGKKDQNKTKYKDDRYHIIKILQASMNGELKIGNIPVNENKFIKISKSKNYHFEYISKGKTKSEGDIIIKENQLEALIDTKNHIKIIKH